MPRGIEGFVPRFKRKAPWRKGPWRKGRRLTAPRRSCMPEAEARDEAAMRIIAIEEHYSTPLYRQKVSANEFRSFYITARGEQIGHDIVKELGDVDASRIKFMD